MPGDIQSLFNSGGLELPSFAAITETASKEDLENTLQSLMDRLKDIDQQSIDVLASYIRNCRDWRFARQRDGLTNFHFEIDTCTVDVNGAMTYIMIDHKIPHFDGLVERSFAVDTNRSIPLPDDVRNTVLEMAESAIFIHYPAEVVRQLRLHAPQDISDIDLARTADQFWQERVIFNENDRPVLTTLFSVISARSIPLLGTVKGIDAISILSSAQHLSASIRAEQVYHFEELREAITALRIGTNRLGEDLTVEVKQELQLRIKEIMGDVTDWRYIVDQQDAFESELRADDEWTADKARVLLKMLLSNDVLSGSAELLAYFDDFSGTQQAAKSLTQLEGTKTTKSLGSIAAKLIV